MAAGSAPPADHDAPLLVETIVFVPESETTTQLPPPSVAIDHHDAAAGTPPALHTGPAIYTPITASMFELVVTGSEMV